MTDPFPPADPIKLLELRAAGQSEELEFDTTAHSADDVGWRSETWRFTATEAETMLQFVSLTDRYAGATSGNAYLDFGPLIDNVGGYLIGFAGDADGDGDVDGSDFLHWQSNFGLPSRATTADGDFDDDGDVDGDDFLIWQSNFGASAGRGAATRLPEPASWGLLLLGVAALGWRRDAASSGPRTMECNPRSSAKPGLETGPA